MFASNALEGNVLSLAETASVIHRGLAVGGRPLEDHLEALDHIDALRYVEELATRPQALAPRTLRTLHGLLMRRSRPAIAGRYRTIAVTEDGADYRPPEAVYVAESVDGLLADYDSRRDADHPVVVAADLHQAIVDVQPFEHGNGPTARLALNLHLMQCGYPLTIIHPDDAARYAQAIRDTRNADPNAFRSFLAENVSRSLARYVRELDANADEPAP